MQISVTLLLCVFLLCCTGSVRVVSSRLRVPTGQLAAMSLLLAALSTFDIQIGKRVSMNAAAVLAVVYFACLCRRQRETYITVLLAFLCGILAWFSRRLMPSFPEPGLLLALPAVVFARVLPLTSRQKMLCHSLSPVFFGLVNTLEEWYLFDAAYFSIGNQLQLNAQIIGVVVGGVFEGVALPRKDCSLDMQKEY